MLTDHLPVLKLRIRTERLELRLPNPEELAALADVAADGVHDPGFMPFLFPWTDTTPAKRARSVALWHHRVIGRWETDMWTIPFTVFFEGNPVGIQEIDGKKFAINREVGTGSWIGLAHHGKGIGTEMRAAVLHFAFAGIGADWAISASFDGNEASQGVSRKLGYRADGIEFHVVQGERRLDRRWRLSREDWEANRRHEVEIDGLDADVLEMMGLGPAVEE
ncbi:GNAT family N-acetyltransferase [Glycomyces buryatensis]|uniref:GNAT family N-acetyltransferase n=1 Tax=Glycomyces buryatensis TaxID=2570927 RepID=A0A4S8QF25_9ACTN|nr:GNAT family protein [Glycomyces buryatensis]THV41722.1 GNAT family N-acetyltransferase [Glycomyces buryatensis]